MNFKCQYFTLITELHIFTDNFSQEENNKDVIMPLIVVSPCRAFSNKTVLKFLTLNPAIKSPEFDFTT
jgi:hypothetical protein